MTDQVSLGQVLAVLAQGALLLFSGVASLLLRGAAKKLEELRAAITDLSREVEAQGRQLARSDQRFTDLERRVEVLEDRMRDHERATS